MSGILALTYSVLRTSLDVQNKKMTVLAPNQISLAGRTAIVGSFEWEEQYK